MISAVVSVCGDDQYFDFADISIPSFLRANRGTTLHVFTDRVERFAERDGLVVHDYDECLRELREERGDTLQRMSTLMGADFNNNGVQHTHAYVAFLPLLAEKFVDSDWLLKVDVDAYFVGDILSDLSEQLNYCGIDFTHDLYLVSRTRGDIMKLFAGVPGVGFTLWRRGASFVERYVQKFDGNEQNTILVVAGYQHSVKTTDYCGILIREECHVCYPFYQAGVNGRELEKSDVDEWVPCYLHLRGPNQLEKLQILKGWYN